jgi:translation initiation factor 4E
MFKDGVKPAWEDPFNEKGGKWSLLIPRASNKSDPSWLYSLLALIGEELDNEDEICGAVISPRRVQDKLAIWTKNADNTEVVMAIGRKLRQVLEIGANDKLEFFVHAEAYSKNAKPRFYC